MNQELINQLALLGIVEESQLEDKELDEWRILKFTEINRKYTGNQKRLENEKIRINQAYSDLQNYSETDLKSFLNSQESSSQKKRNKKITENN